MLKLSRTFLFLAVIVLLFIGCSDKNRVKTFSRHPLGYWWQLLAFKNDSTVYKRGHIAWINAVFKTQDDSVFYDSRHDTRDRLFMTVDSVHASGCLQQLVSRCSEGDSLCMLVAPSTFFAQHFKSGVPAFCSGDSVIKVSFGIKQMLTPDAYAAMAKQIGNNELKEIEQFFGSNQKMMAQRDSSGFYWVERPAAAENNEAVKQGDQISVSYEGAFLDGRVMDISPPGFTLNYGTPDQLVKGLNNVIGRLKLGQNSKIILPSHLAFGENGSSNGSIPPFTPMLYKISIKK